MARGRQQSFEFRTHGGKRKGAGRKQVKARKSEPHRKRSHHDARNPVHIVLRVDDAVGRLRRAPTFCAIQNALLAALHRVEDFRICHISIQNKHIHMIVEAKDQDTLSKGVQGFAISCARRVNTALGRTGTVFPDRYHAVPITNPTQCRNALRYVISNWRHHDEDRPHAPRPFDPYSSGQTFGGWTNASPVLVLNRATPILSVAYARTWMLTDGWKRVGRLSPWTRPG